MTKKNQQEHIILNAQIKTNKMKYKGLILSQKKFITQKQSQGDFNNYVQKIQGVTDTTGSY